MTEVFSTPAIFLVTGIMAAGKSSVAQELAERFPKSVHLRGDLFRRMMVNGQATMDLTLSAEAVAQLQLRYRLAQRAAGEYVGAGFTVVYQDIVIGQDLTHAVNALRQYPLYVVVLCPSVSAVAEREEGRNKTGYGPDFAVADFDRAFRAETPRLGLWVDSSTLTVGETVDYILDHLADARITQ